jgi:hypothetical protein
MNLVLVLYCSTNTYILYWPWNLTTKYTIHIMPFTYVEGGATCTGQSFPHACKSTIAARGHFIENKIEELL